MEKSRGPGVVDYLTFTLVIVGAINWGLVGLFGFDLVASIFGEMSMITRIVYDLVGISGVYCIFILMKWGRMSKM